MTLPEDGLPEQIVGWFRDHGWALTLHTDPPPRGDASGVPQALRLLPRFTHWADLVSLETGSVVARWYGGGMDEAQAVRSAGRRWRTEQPKSSSHSEEGQQRTQP
jgi:hypothetical protein